MRLFLIRHAQSANNARAASQRIEDPELTPVGHAQAARLADAVNQLELTHIITSPFLRALQTAEYLQRVTGLEPLVRTAIHEKGGCVAGTVETGLVGRPGMTRSQIAARFPDYQVDPEIDGQGWWGGKPFETLAQAEARARRVWDAICQEFRGSHARVAYVMHGDFLLLLLGCFHKNPLNLAWNASLTSVKVSGDGAQLEDYANVEHLPNYLVTW